MLLSYMSTGGGVGGLIGYPLPPKNFAGAAGKNFQRCSCQNLGENCKIWRENSKILMIFHKIWTFFNIFENFWSNFEVDFGNPCDYHKSVKKNFEIFMTPPPKIFRKVDPPHTIFGRAHVWLLYFQNNI